MEPNSCWYVSSHNAKIFESGASGKRVLTRNGYLSKTNPVIVSFELLTIERRLGFNSLAAISGRPISFPPTLTTSTAQTDRSEGSDAVKGKKKLFTNLDQKCIRRVIPDSISCCDWRARTDGG